MFGFIFTFGTPILAIIVMFGLMMCEEEKEAKRNGNSCKAKKKLYIHNIAD